MTPETSTFAIIADVLRRGYELIQKELRLTKAEISDSINRAAVAIGLLVAAAVMGIIALNLLAGTLVTALVVNGLSTVWATLLVAALFGVFCLILIMKAKRDLKYAANTPARTAERIRRDTAVLKEAANDTRS
ncbi:MULTISPECIES: phage holin family protein [Halocynthiibacter]|uniref:Phage holin family protein n=1 Tax=Halocynthiibacter halioticoli TaxID=2986804 RepID=A0AAE3LRQ1_9RHOB|nr:MULTISPECIES: phage holin family protein [Halocynthiibacter]MCV6824848.1 phage holin family protein [Halocynthiibacter halioticoli]MCW4057849.1 phage holin family protein [Halocynthiibacter sp. SDUM655004]MDE0589127.1 phage holin family protein [Halocynthiibacter sp. C4]